MVAAHQITRIREVFGREPFLLEWVLRDPVARTSGLIANLTEFQREFLYQYCVLDMLRLHFGGRPSGSPDLPRFIAHNRLSSFSLRIPMQPLTPHRPST